MARVAFVMEQTLGHVTHARNLRAVLDATPSIEARWLPIPFEVAGAARLIPLYGNNWSVRASWRARRELKHALARGPLDALFFHTQVTSLFSVDLMHRIPTVVSLDATPFNFDAVGASYGHRAATDGFLDRQKYQLNCRALQAAETLVAWSEWTKRSLVEEYGCEARRVLVLAPGASSGFFDVGRRRLESAGRDDVSRSADEPTRILFVGGDWERKGGPVLLEALAGLPAGSWRLDAVTHASGPVGPNVFVHRDIAPNSPELLRLFSEADLFVLPSLGECLAVVLMEATAAALPVVTTDVGALAEAVRPDRTGLIVPPRDVSALRDALGTLIAEPARRRIMSEAAFDLARERFDANRNNRTLLDLLAEHARLGARPGRAA